MERREYAKQINCTIDYLSRAQGTNWQEDWKEGDILEVGKDLGMCWTDGGEFTPENNTEFLYIIKATGNMKAHKVDYNNEKECFDLGCEDCEKENEFLLQEGTKFVITYISSNDDYKEMGYYVVELN